MSNLKSTQPRGESQSADATQLICPYCQRRFQSADQMTLHVVTRHTWNGKNKDKQEPAVSGKS